jgi:pimeloyl-ACP methyl ester carboxylesterase
LRKDEVEGLSELAGDAFAGTVERVQDMHEGVAGRVFDQIGPLASPVRLLHDGIARGVYETIRILASPAIRTSGRALAATRATEARSIEAQTRGRIALGALNGAFGDSLATHGNTLALPMTVRSDDGERDVELTATDVREAFPDATGKLAIFAHGLCETDDAWRIGGERHVTYGDRLRSELGYTPVYLRYNSGLHISENGRRLARLIDDLIGSWPREVHEIVLIGHSMGGLIERSACHYGGEWTEKVRHVFTLGSPHRGARLEQVANTAGAALSLLPETRSLAKALNSRSVGIKDLRYGYLVDEDWAGQDPDAMLRDTGGDIPFLRTADHYFVCATLTHDPGAAVGRIIGDLLVLRASAWDHGGHGERLRFPVDNYRHVGGATHFDLLGHPAIYAQIKLWLTSGRALPAPALN